MIGSIIESHFAAQAQPEIVRGPNISAGTNGEGIDASGFWQVMMIVALTSRLAEDVFSLQSMLRSAFEASPDVVFVQEIDVRLQ